MAALATDRNTKSKSIELSYAPRVAATTVIYGGSMVMIVAGVAKPAADAASVIGVHVKGVADARADNSAGAAGDKRVKLRRGVFKFAKSGTIAETDVGKTMYVADDQSVQVATGTNSVVAGELLEIDEDGGVWIKIAP